MTTMEKIQIKSNKIFKSRLQSSFCLIQVYPTHVTKKIVYLLHKTITVLFMNFYIYSGINISYKTSVC